MTGITHTHLRSSRTTASSVCVLALALFTSPATAQLINGSFELGGVGEDIPGWEVNVTPSAPVSRVTNSFLGSLIPTDGTWMVELPDTQIVSTNAVFLRAGDRVLLDISVDAYESGTFEMGAEIRHRDTTEGDRFTLNASQWGQGWRTVELTAPVSGDYLLTAGWIGAATTNAYVYVDNVRIVPSPGIAPLLATGGLLAARRRRR